MCPSYKKDSWKNLKTKPISARILKIFLSKMKNIFIFIENLANKSKSLQFTQLEGEKVKLN